MVKKKLFTIIVLCIFMLPVIAYADMGPKDRLTVYVENPPDELYYLDLLTQNTSEYNNFYNEGGREALNQYMLSLLYNYEGWKPAFTEGTGLPMWGSLTGEKQENRMVHEFGYVGLPDTYRIIIVTERGTVSVSEIFERKVLQSSITYDYETGKATTPGLWGSYLLQFISTCIPTLLIEGLILLLFRIKLRDNIKVFLSTNVITQVILTLTMGTALIRNGTITAFFIQFPVEIIILIFETLVYFRFLMSNSRRRSLVYGITANLTSWILGFLALPYQYELIVALLNRP